jgi:membrane-associated phospholipid phosphatase
MPSLHIAWAAWSALAVWRIFAHRRWAALVWAYPVVTAVAVMATGNHYLLDVLAGAATMIVATVLADGLYRWGWRLVPVRFRRDRRSAGVDEFEPVTEAVVDVPPSDPWTLVGPPERYAGGFEPGQ